jgi:hypothetical protein
MLGGAVLATRAQDQPRPSWDAGTASEGRPASAAVGTHIDLGQTADVVDGPPDETQPHGDASGADHGHSHDHPEGTLVDNLIRGGYVVVARPDLTQSVGPFDETPANPDDCRAQRNLSDAGQANSRRVGKNLSAVQVGFSKAFASPYCRTVQTSENMFGSTEKAPELANASGETAADAAGSVLRAFIEELTPGRGGNIAVTVDGAAFTAAYGAELREGEIAVLQKNGGTFDVLQIIHADALRDLTDAVPTSSRR